MVEKIGHGPDNSREGAKADSPTLPRQKRSIHASLSLSRQGVIVEVRL